MMRMKTSDMDAYLFDLDGCIYYGDSPAPGAVTLLEVMKRDQKPCFFVTNNSTHSGEQIAERLRGMGLEVNADQVLTVTEYLGQYVLDKYGRRSIKAAGSAALMDALARCGHQLIEMDSVEQPEVVIIGRDTEFTYSKLQTIAHHAERGALLIAGNPDTYHLGKLRERIPETGALAAAVEAVVERQVEYVGKPEPHIFKYAAYKYGLNLERCVMVGDNYDTDILGGYRSGMQTIWISGDSSRSSAARKLHDLAVDHMQELYELYINPNPNEKGAKIL